MMADYASGMTVKKYSNMANMDRSCICSSCFHFVNQSVLNEYFSVVGSSLLLFLFSSHFKFSFVC